MACSSEQAYIYGIYMGKKLTYTFVKSSFEKEGYTLLSKEYINSQTKLNYRCSMGHGHSITWGNWVSGYRCPHCAGNVKVCIEDVKSSFESEGCTLLTETYINSKQPLDFICSNGHKGSICLSSWRRGVRCAKCYGNNPYSFEQVKNLFDAEGYVLLTNTYVNNKSILKYKCPFGHIHTTSLNSWLTGRRCRTCAYIDRSGPWHPNWRGGKSFEKYCAVWQDQEFKQDIRERDRYVCLNPYCTSDNPEDLTIHHIDYDKKNCHPRNLITICRSCNSKANTDRRWHKAWYQAIIHNRYAY